MDVYKEECHQRSVLLRDEHPGLLWLYKIWVKSGDCVGRIFSGFPLRKKLAICYDMIMTWTTHDLEKTPKIYHRKTEEICVYVRSMTVQGVRTHLILHNSAFLSFQQQQFHLCRQFMLWFETWGLVWQIGSKTKRLFRFKVFFLPQKQMKKWSPHKVTLVADL